MQDRFKCRMYDKNAKKMYSFENDCLLETTFECLKQQLAFDSKLNIFNPIAYNHIADGRIFMQCTGLKDKNGELIYEGDILEGYQTLEVSPLDSKMVLKRGLVRIPDGMFVATCHDIKENCTLFTQLHWSTTKVIGNVYQNPELLEDK